MRYWPPGRRIHRTVDYHYHPGGGFTRPSGAVTTVANAKSLRDDTLVTLRGKIVERISDDLYKFRMLPG